MPLLRTRSQGHFTYWQSMSKEIILVHLVQLRDFLQEDDHTGIFNPEGVLKEKTDNRDLERKGEFIALYTISLLSMSLNPQDGK